MSIETYLLYGTQPAVLTPFWTLYALTIGIPGVTVPKPFDASNVTSSDDGDLHFLATTVNLLGLAEPYRTDYFRADILGSSLARLALAHQLVTDLPDDEETCTTAVSYVLDTAHDALNVESSFPEPASLEDYLEFRRMKNEEIGWAMEFGKKNDPNAIEKLAELNLFGQSRTMVGSWNGIIVFGYALMLGAFLFFISTYYDPKVYETRHRRYVSLAIVLVFIAWLSMVRTTAFEFKPQAIPKNETAAKEYYQQASDLGVTQASYTLALLALDAEDLNKADRYLELVKKDGTDSQKVMAQYFAYKHGLLDETKNDTLALEALRPVLETETMAQIMYASETKNQTEQLKYFTLAAKAGNVLARYNAGILNLLHNRSCEAYKYFSEVAYDNDPLSREMFALAVKSYSEDHIEEAALGFAVLAKTGNYKAAINAAELMLQLPPKQCKHPSILLYESGKYCCTGPERNCESPDWDFSNGKISEQQCIDMGWEQLMKKSTNNTSSSDASSPASQCRARRRRESPPLSNSDSESPPPATRSELPHNATEETFTPVNNNASLFAPSPEVSREESLYEMNDDLEECPPEDTLSSTTTSSSDMSGGELILGDGSEDGGTSVIMYATTYDTQWCQLSSHCEEISPAGDASARIYRLDRRCCLSNPAQCAIDLAGGMKNTNHFVAKALESQNLPSADLRCGPDSSDEARCVLALSSEGRTHEALKRIQNLTKLDSVTTFALWSTLAVSAVRDAFSAKESIWDGSLWTELHRRHPWFF